jgi:tripartite-type tricarboxylate transporter receptor subunit TctC
MKRLALLLLAIVLGHAPAGADEPLSFKGKNITLIVASAPGGGTDISGRLIGNFLASHLSGKPNVVVRNIPGAQGVTAMNHFIKQVAPDGLTLTMGSTSQADPLLYRKPTSLFDPTTFPFVGGVGRGGTVLLIRKDAEARLFDKNTAPVVMGSLGGVPRSGMQTTAWGIAFLDWNAKWVVGYPGTSDLMIALERGEIDMTSTANLFQVQKFLDSGKFKILTQSGTLKNGQMLPRPEFGDAPLIANLMKSKINDPLLQHAFDYWVSLTALDKWIALPPKSPENYIQAYRDAFQAAFTDPEFAELGKKVSEDLEPMSHQDIDFLVQRLGATPPEALTFISTMLRKQGLESE